MFVFITDKSNIMIFFSKCFRDTEYICSQTHDLFSQKQICKSGTYY